MLDTLRKFENFYLPQKHYGGRNPWAHKVSHLKRTPQSRGARQARKWIHKYRLAKSLAGTLDIKNKNVRNAVRLGLAKGVEVSFKNRGQSYVKDDFGFPRVQVGPGRSSHDVLSNVRHLIGHAKQTNRATSRIGTHTFGGSGSGIVGMGAPRDSRELKIYARRAVRQGTITPTMRVGDAAPSRWRRKSRGLNDAEAINLRTDMEAWRQAIKKEHGRSSMKGMRRHLRQSVLNATVAEKKSSHAKIKHTVNVLNRYSRSLKNMSWKTKRRYAMSALKRKIKSRF